MVSIDGNHGFRITRLPDYLSMCFVKAFIILNTSFNYGLSKLVMYSLTTDPETSWVNYIFIIQITTNAKLMEIIHRNIQSIYPAAWTVLRICKQLKIIQIIIILFWISLNSNYCGYKLLLQTRALIKLSLLLQYQWIEKYSLNFVCDLKMRQDYWIELIILMKRFNVEKNAGKF